MMTGEEGGRGHVGPAPLFLVQGFGPGSWDFGFRALGMPLGFGTYSQRPKTQALDAEGGSKRAGPEGPLGKTAAGGVGA